MIRIQNILVATDFSEPSEAALNYGRELARSFHATLHVVHVTDSIYAQYGGEAYSVALPELQSEIEDSARKELERLLNDEDRRDLRARPVLITALAKAPAIVEYAGQNSIDLIVMGTHGRGAISHMLMGSVAERVVRTASCLVLTVHHPEREFVLPDTLVAVARR